MDGATILIKAMSKAAACEEEEAMRLDGQTRRQNAWENNQFQGRSRNNGSGQRPEVWLDRQLHGAAPGAMAGSVMVTVRVTQNMVRCEQVPGPERTQACRHLPA